MSLISQISDELKAAMKAGDVLKRDTLRFLQSALKNSALDARKSVTDLTDAEAQDVVKRMVKQRKDSIAQYRSAGREDLALKEEAELTIVSVYLPTQLSREAVEAIIAKVLLDMGEVSTKDAGRVMGAVMKEVAGQADGALVRELVMAKLK